MIKDFVDAVENEVKNIDREERMTLIEKYTDDYVCMEDRPPEDDDLERLADAILHEELSDKRADKMSLEEYPIMSDNQKGRRQEGKQRPRNKSNVIDREVQLLHASNVASNGKDYTLPIRSFKNPD